MSELLQFLLRHGYALLFGFVLIEQMGLPVPAIPVLLAMGALVKAGKFGFLAALGAAVVAAALSDATWFAIGRARGRRVLKLLCKISIEPDSCVRSTEDRFRKYGSGTLLFAKFVPGLSTAAPPMAGMVGMSLPAFLICDAAGTVIWAGTFLGLGFAFEKQLQPIANLAAQLGLRFVMLLAAGLLLYLGWKLYQRYAFMSRLRVARITPDEVKQRMDAGEELVIIDMRHAREVAETMKLPGALELNFDELQERHQEIPRDRDIILYCS